ncbi:hypothetical protein BGW39_002607 [Mortierella sp. 14UC]|nr:hypothetical protein BGW39_002607 [Mortierella sp. 14UC]
MKNIYLNFGRFMGQEALPIRSVLPDCELLESLGIEGEWFREETKQEFEEHPEPWCLQRLITPRSHLQIVRRCPELRAITLSARLDLDAETSIAPITTCGNLQELHFSGVNGFRVNNFREVLPQVQSLTALTIEHVTQEHFARLDVLQNATSAPRLKVLVLGRIGVAMGGELLAKENQQLLVNILQAHQGLETFELKGLSINVLSFFTSIEGDQHKAFCPCPQLKKLSLEIHTTSMLESNPATMNSLWELVYTQLGRMNQLETLMLKSSGLKVTVEAGFLLLGKTTKLKSLTLSDPNRPTWTVSGLKRLLAVAPELRTLDLKPLTPSHRRQINAWFKAHEKGFLRF